MNLQQDAIYPSLATDSDGKPLDGNNNYVLRFEKGKDSVIIDTCLGTPCGHLEVRAERPESIAFGNPAR